MELPATAALLRSCYSYILGQKHSLEAARLGPIVAIPTTDRYTERLASLLCEKRAE